MSIHSYSRCWVHFTWGTLRREHVISKQAAAKLSKHLNEYAKGKGIYMKINYVNADHVHVLIDLPTKYSMEEVMKLLKGESSWWANEKELVLPKLVWGRGYGAFSVSHSHVDKVCKYIANQEEDHRKKTFREELELFVRKYGLQWHEDDVGE